MYGLHAMDRFLKKVEQQMDTISADKSSIPYFFDQTSWLLYFSLLVLVRLILEGGVYVIRKPVDSNDG